MFRIDNSTVAATQPAPTPVGTPGFFTDGSAGGGVPATVVSAEFLNCIQEELVNAVTAAGRALSKTSFNQLATAIASISPGRLLAIRALTSSGTYTPTPGTKNIRVRAWGGGGGGAGSTTSTIGFGGGGGGYCEWYGPLSALGAGPTYPYAVGAAGTAGASGGGNGGSGGSTSLGGTQLVAGGGQGGINAGGGGGGGAVSILMAGVLAALPGREGQGGTTASLGGNGGNAFAGAGGVPHNTAGGAGIAGGGGAGAGNAGPAAFVGGAGGAGLMIIEESSV